VDAYLRLLAEAGILTPKLRDAALKAQSEFRNAAPPAGSWSFAERKGSDAIRVALLAMLGVDSTYELDQLDLAVESGFDKYVTDEVAQRLRRLASPSAAAAAGVTGHRLLNPANDVSSVFYSFSLYERSGGANYLRAQVDTFNGPLNVNEGTKLELGSTAKLRTLVTYLETVARLHANYAGLAPAELQSAPVDRQDRLTRWAIDFMAVAPDKTLPAMLESAMNRIYSASPDEAFFTGGGVHLFSNFEPKDNARVMTVREAFQRSVNLVFIRLMRDLAYHYRSPEPGLAPAVLADERHPLRRQYLERFADREGREFLARFYRKYRDLAPQQALDTLLRETPAVAYRLAAAYRFLEPDANPNALAEFLAARLPAGRPVFSQVDALYRDYAPGRFHLNDAGFLARVHPLELWTAAYLRKHPGAGFDEILRASERERQEAYAWLFKPGRKQGQDIRILSILEADAFQAIHRSWKRQGYPFATLVPSYATAIGSSGDTPAALAELAGIIVNGGVRYPASRFERLHFAQGTPFETVVARRAPPPERVLAPEVAAVLRQELLGVVERGTARRAYGAVALNDGTRIAVGGKTGTGDNRLDIFGVGGAILESRPMNRTATFVFTVGDRFFGTVVAYVPGPEAGAYQFTSALPLQVFRDLVPAFLPLVEESERRAGTRALTGG
jgi:membrane peptidoglycan carboxypeptidase